MKEKSWLWGLLLLGDLLLLAVGVGFIVKEPFYVRDYDAFANGAIIVMGAIFMVAFAAVFTTRGDDQ